MKDNFYRLIFLMLCIFLQACSRQPTVANGKVISVETHSLNNALFYSGTVQPLKTLVIPSPADGIILDMPFQYGEEIDAGKLLFMISSSKFMTDYKSALLTYIKAKSEFNNSQMQLTEATFLHKNQLISDDDFKTKQSSYYANQLALLQAKDALENLLHQLDIKDVDLYKLTIADIDKITQAMHMQKSSENLPILAPATGIVLSPAKNEDEIKKIAKGDVVKQGDVLAIIGDMSGLSVRIKVNELIVNQLKAGQKVKVTGIAFPDEALDGRIERVDRQGETASGGLPTFSVEVIVPKLTKKQQSEIHVGMSAKIEVSLDETPQVIVPIAAIHDKHTVSYVQMYDEKTGKVHETPVQTGKTTMDSVAILSGLNAGDKIVIPN